MHPYPRLSTSSRYRFRLYLLLFLAVLAVYLRTLAPTIATLFDDSLEFQLVAFQPGIAHPTGYPLYTLLGKLFTWLPVGDVAYRVNLLSAVAAAGAVTSLAWLLRRLGLPALAVLTGVLALAFSRTFWSQATIAEVYTLHALFVVLLLGLTLRLPEAPAGAHRVWYAWAALLGLSLTHHRTILLLWPALLAYLWWTRRTWADSRPPWKAVLGSALAPLLLYLYIPLRGLSITSLDGTYENTWSGFWQWVTASGYGSFFSANPLAPHYAIGDYLSLAGQQFGLLGWALAAVGLVAAWRQDRHRAGLFLLAGLTNLLFAVGYQVPDVEVFFIPVFLIVAIFIAWGAQMLVGWGARLHRQNPGAAGGLLVALVLLGMLPSWAASFRAVDRSNQWAVYEDGLDALHQPLPDGAVVIGILGEMTRLRYFQQTAGLRPDLRTVAADREADRLAAVRENMAAGRTVYLTRPLPGVESRYALAVEGPLIRVLPAPLSGLPASVHRIDQPVSDDIALLAYQREPLARRDGNRLRLTLYWQPAERLPTSLKVSARLLDATGEKIAQQDGIPVHNAYPTTAWRAGEIVRDGYDLPLPDGPGKATDVLVIVYDPSDLHEIGRLEWPLD
ncbi:MAG: DUF2723 domain-containing protein [Chloroflexi bacterium]|nr:DUF2723 domain-containing protein [Chloroflexota bacterium]